MASNHAATLWITVGVLFSSSMATGAQRNALFCGGGKLDLSCPSFPDAAMNTPLLGLAPLAERYATQAYVVRWGEGRKARAEPRWVISLGSRVRRALFWAAVASVLL